MPIKNLYFLYLTKQFRKKSFLHCKVPLDPHNGVAHHMQNTKCAGITPVHFVFLRCEPPFPYFLSSFE